MLKDSGWSMAKGKKIIRDDNSPKATPIIIRHDNYRTKTQNNKKDSLPIPVLNQTDVTNESDKIPDVSMENIEETSIETNKNLRKAITVECPRLNESAFRSTINYTEAKGNIFQNGLALPTNLLSSVRMTFNKYPAIHFKLNKEIDVNTIVNPIFAIEGRYHSGGIFIIDKIQCKVVGLPKINPITTPRPDTRPETRSHAQSHSNHANARVSNQSRNQDHIPDEEQTVRINGIYTSSDIPKVTKWLKLYGELLTDITEEYHHDLNPNSQNVGNRCIQVLLLISWIWMVLSCVVIFSVDS